MRYGIILACLMLSNLAFGEITMQSGVSQANLVELYTSEGCSSCPPADRWMSKLKAHPALWQRVVPIAFHVDYWDYIGWKDRFARPEFTARQRQYAKENSVSTIYTPGLMSNGKEWRNFAWLAQPKTEKRNVGALTATVGDEELTVGFQPAEALQHRGLVANVALLGFGLTSDVRAGENKGRELKHDFVVLELTRSSMIFNDGSYQVTASRPRSDVSADRYAIALWVSTDDEQMPLQAVGSWLDK